MNRQAKPSIDSLLRSFKHVLDASDFPDAVKDNAPLGLKRRVGEFLDRRENRGGRRVKREPMRRARKTLKHVTHAVGHAGLHEDSNIQTRAKALVRSLQHRSFDEIEQQASKFNGLLRKAGQRRNERRRKKARRRYKVAGVTILGLNSVPQLKTTGKNLALCVAHGDELGRDHHDRLRSNASEFWRVERRGTATGLIEIDCESRRVVEAAGRGNRMLKLKRKEARGILRILNATADDIDTFSRVGAFCTILDSRPKDVTPIAFDGREFRIWPDRDSRQVVIEMRRPASADGSRKALRRWSLFRREEPEHRRRLRIRRGRRMRRLESHFPEWCEGCCHPGAISTGEFTDLVLRSPEIAGRVREVL